VVFFNYTTMQMTAKVVYYGPGLCGKTTNLQFIHHRTAPKSRGEMVSLETETDRTLFFDLLPLEVGVIGGMKVRLQLYTVPGQVFYNATRKLVLKGVDGIVFVADSQRAALETNLESLHNLKENLRELGLGADPVPIVLQFNKRDLRGVLSVDELNASLNPEGRPFFEAAALHGIGVFETLKAISKLAINSVRQKLGPAEPRRGVGSPFAQAPAAVPAPPPKAAPAPVSTAPASTAPVATAAPATAVSEIESLVSAPGGRADELPVEFAEEDTGTHDVRAVRTQALGDIHAELEKLRAIAAAAAPSKPQAAPRRLDIDRRLQEMLTPEGAARQDIKRKASLDVPSEVLKSAVAMRVQVAFTNEEGETVQEAVVVPLGANRRLERVALHLDLDIKSKA
jgi:signal recognition particle receptor subunit beta